MKMRSKLGQELYDWLNTKKQQKPKTEIPNIVQQAADDVNNNPNVFGDVTEKDGVISRVTIRWIRGL